MKLICESKVADDEETGNETNTTKTNTFEKTLAYVKRFGGRAALWDEHYSIFQINFSALSRLSPAVAGYCRSVAGYSMDPLKVSHYISTTLESS